MIVVRNALPRMIARSAVRDFPDASWEFWHKYNSPVSKKLGSVDVLRFPRSCLNALDMLAHVMSNHVPDEEDALFFDFNHHGSGMHMIEPGGWLSRHLDADVHPMKNWQRAGSIVWFGNEEWAKEWGGHLKVDGETVVPEFNMAVMFDCNDESWHEVTRVTGPQARRTLSLFVWRELPFGYSSPRTSAFFQEQGDAAASM